MSIPATAVRQPDGGFLVTGEATFLSGCWNSEWALVPAPEVEEGQDFTANLNPNSLEVLTGCRLEPSVAGAEPGSRYQFERNGYFCVDPDSTADQLVFNRTVTLKDTWAKIKKRK